MDENIIPRLKKLGQLYKEGLLTQEEFEEQKRRILTGETHAKEKSNQKETVEKPNPRTVPSDQHDTNPSTPPNDIKRRNKKIVVIAIIAVIIIAAAIAIPLSISHKREAERQQQLELARLDSIQREEARLEIENREDSINFESNRLKPTHFIKRVSSKCYAFADPDIYSNLQAFGFIKGRTSERGYNSSTYDEFGYDVDRTIRTDYNRDTKEGNANINIIQYNVDWGGFCTSEFYITINFEDERSKNAFLSDLLKMNFVYQNEQNSHITIGNFNQPNTNFLDDPVKITVDYSQPLKIIMYSEEALKIKSKLL